jgi:hypothetical protein
VKTLSKALRQTTELKVVKLAVRSLVRLWEISDWTLWRSPPQTKKETTDSLHAGIAEAPATFKSSVPTNREKKCRPQQNVEVPFTRGMSPCRLLRMSSLKEGAM